MHRSTSVNITTKFVWYSITLCAIIATICIIAAGCTYKIL